MELDAVFSRALAKRPRDRYATCGEFVAALGAALNAEAGRTRAYPTTQIPVASRFRHAPRWPLVAAALGAALVVAVLLGVTLSGNSSPPRADLKAPTSTPAVRQPVVRTTDPHALNDRAWSLMKQGQYAAALPLLERAVSGLRGTGPSDPAEGYANYNLGYTLLQLGRCSEARTYLQRAEQLEPQRTEVRSALDAVQQCLAPKPTKHGKKKGHHKGHDQRLDAG